MTNPHDHGPTGSPAGDDQRFSAPSGATSDQPRESEGLTHPESGGQQSPGSGDEFTRPSGQFLHLADPRTDDGYHRLDSGPPGGDYPEERQSVPQQYGQVPGYASAQAYPPGWHGAPGPYPGFPQQAWAVPPKKRKKWPIAIGVIGLAAAAVGGAWLIADRSRTDFEDIAQECENTLDYDTLLALTGGYEYMREALDVAYSEWQDILEEMSNVPRFVTVASDVSSIKIDDSDFGSIDSIDFLWGTSGSQRERLETFVTGWNGARDIAIVAAVSCVHDKLDIPDSVESRMMSTRALDGTQEATHAGIRMTWNYHPSSGLGVIYERE